MPQAGLPLFLQDTKTLKMCRTCIDNVQLVDPVSITSAQKCVRNLRNCLGFITDCRNCSIRSLHTFFNSAILQDFQEKSAYFRISEEKLQISGLHKFSPQIQTQRCPQRLKDLMNGDRHATTRTVASSALQLGILADWLHSSPTQVLSAFTYCWAFLVIGF